MRRLLLLLTQKQLLGQAAFRYFQSHLHRGNESEEIDRQPAENPIVPLTAENLAYVIYTSGSTGQPQGQ